MFNSVFRDDVFDARSFSLNGNQAAKPSYFQGRYSFQVGGPLMIPGVFRLEKTTFNFNYTKNRSDDGRSSGGYCAGCTGARRGFFGIKPPYI
jgi:hypothetical protein